MNKYKFSEFIPATYPSMTAAVDMIQSWFDENQIHVRLSSQEMSVDINVLNQVATLLDFPFKIYHAQSGISRFRQVAPGKLLMDYGADQLYHKSKYPFTMSLRFHLVDLHYLFHNLSELNTLYVVKQLSANPDPDWPEFELVDLSAREREMLRKIQQDTLKLNQKRSEDRKSFSSKILADRESSAIFEYHNQLNDILHQSFEALNSSDMVCLSPAFHWRVGIYLHRYQRWILLSTRDTIWISFEDDPKVYKYTWAWSLETHLTMKEPA